MEGYVEVVEMSKNFKKNKFFLIILEDFLYFRYYCICTPEYYGKTCEFRSDPINCINNRCLNNATCYRYKSVCLFNFISIFSVKNNIMVINPDLLVDNSNKAEEIPTTIYVNYQ